MRNKVYFVMSTIVDVVKADNPIEAKYYAAKKIENYLDLPLSHIYNQDACEMDISNPYRKIGYKAIPPNLHLAD